MDMLVAIKRYRQTICMVISLLLLIAFFIPWFSNNKDLEMFEQANTSVSGFGIVRAIDYIRPTVEALADTYGYPAAKWIRIGYVLLVLPLLGLLGLFAAGLRWPHARKLQTAHYIATLVMILIMVIAISIKADIRTLFFTVMRIDVGIPLSLMLSLTGLLALNVMPQKR